MMENVVFTTTRLKQSVKNVERALQQQRTKLVCNIGIGRNWKHMKL